MDTCLTLGLDLGSNSIGWAVVDEPNHRIIATGVRVFPEGVNRDTKEAEVSKNEARRTARMARRQASRRAARTRRLRQVLVDIDLLPSVATLEPGHPERVAWEREAFQAADPYSLRRRALTERLTRHEIGRVFIHLSQRRGFLSNRKADRARRDETKGMLGEISQLQAQLKERTLGEFLAQEQELHPHVRLRRRHTRRDMYEKEFDAIWTAQQQHYPKVLTEQLKYGTQGKQIYPCNPRALGKKSAAELFGIHGCLFFQRSLYWPKSVVGACELEPKEKRCPRAYLQVQRFRLLQEVNNLRVLEQTTAGERALTPDERKTLIDYLADSNERSFDDIRKKLRLPTARFNLEGDRKKLQGLPTDKLLKKLIGKTWAEAATQRQSDLTRILLDGEEQEIRDYCRKEWRLDDDVVDKLLDAQLPAGYASYSLQAIEKLLPFLDQGLPMTAPTGQPCALQSAGYLQPHELVVNQRDLLPTPPEITNPLVRQALFEVRKVVNAILREYGKPARIHIELAREIKGTKAQRDETSRRMRERERERDKAADQLRLWGVKPTRGGMRDAIDRYLLWEEQDHKCVYSGRPISQYQLLAGEVEMDHVLPYSRTLDDSIMNRVLCFRDENDRKGDRTPFEWMAEQNPAKYEEVLQRADKLPYGKARKFREQTVALDDFLPRQLVDSQYIARQVHDYVQCLGADVVCTKGNHTATLRQHWGLNRVLRQDDLDIKNRDDHRHHAVDAIIIALTDRSRLQQLSRLRKTGVVGEVMPDPWEHFHNDTETAVNTINVSHRVCRKVRGPLHEETLYGSTHSGERRDKASRPWARDWIEEDGIFVYRKSVDSLTVGEVGRIRDQRVKELILDRLARFGVITGRKKKGINEEGAVDGISASRSIPKEVWKEPILLTSRKGESRQSAIIKKVRLTKPELSIRPIRNGQAYVKPGSLHHVCIFEFQDKGKTKREPVFVSMFEAAQRVRMNSPVIQRVHPQRPEAKFIISLSRGEMLFGCFKGAQRLVVFNTAASTQGQLYFVVHTDARMSGAVKKIATTANTLQARKVTVDPLGRLRWAND